VDAAPGYRPDLWFHGPSWRVIRQLSPDGLTADLAPGCDATRALDAAHQLLAAWGSRAAGWLGLPVGADRWRIRDGQPVRVVARAEVSGEELVGAVEAVDLTGAVVLRGEGVRLRAARREATRVG
jgi:hypothetical protein